MASGVVVSLADAKAHLRFPNPTQVDSVNDSIIQGLIDAAVYVLNFECDQILPQLYSERHDGGSFKVFTHHKPLLNVKNVEEGWGWINYELDYQDTNTDPAGTTMFGYSIDNAEVGEISRRTVASVPIPFIPGEKNIFIQYVAGRVHIPPNIVLAVKELVAHWFQNSQTRAVIANSQAVSYDTTMGASFTRDTESGLENINIGVPTRILELIKADRRLPIIA